MTRAHLFTIVCFAALFSSACDQKLTVRISQGGLQSPTLTEDVDQILMEMSKAVAIADSGSDVACAEGLTFLMDSERLPRIFTRQGPIRRLEREDGGPAPDRVAGVMTLRSVFDGPGYVKIVDSIATCGGEEITPGILGCGALGGGSFIVVPVPPNERLPNFFPTSRDNGELWAHEFGHTAGLEHNPPQSMSSSNFIMSGIQRFEGGQDELTVRECVLFSLDKDPSGVPGLSGRLDDRSQPAPGMPLDEFLRSRWIHGIPVMYAGREYGPADVPALIRILDDPRGGEYMKINAATVLGMVGRASHAADLIRFSESMRRDLGPGHLMAFDASMMALGYLAHRTSSDEALRYLASGTDVDLWDGFWVRAEELALASAMGLALSGAPEARPMLDQMRTRMADEGTDPLLLAQMDYFMAAHAEIGRNGLASYYEER